MHPASPDPTTPPVTTYRVEGMTCGHCEAAVRSEVEAIDGVHSAVASAADGTLVVHGAASRAQLAAAVDEAGYTLAKD